MFLQKEDVEGSADKEGKGSPEEAPITTEPQSANQPIKNEPIALGPPPAPPAPAPRHTATSDGASVGAPSSEKSPLYSADEKPQLYEGYGY